MQKITLRTVGDYSLHAQIAPVIAPANHLALTVTSQKLESRHPHEEYVRLFVCLERDSLRALGEFILAQLELKPVGEGS